MASSQQSQIVYTVFSTDMPMGGKAPGPAQAGEQTSDMDKALKEAERLFATGKFLKVEVKKKYAEEKTGRQIEITLKVFEGRIKKDRSLLIFSVLAVLAGAGAFAAAYLMTRQDAPPAIAEGGAPPSPAPEADESSVPAEGR